MSFITEAIRLDSEYRQLIDAVKKEFSTHKAYPIAISGLSDGASDSAIISLVEDTKEKRGKMPLVIICPEEKECLRLQKLFTQYGARAGFYLNRDLNFYNITASHEYEHERLKVLFGILNSELDVVISTPDAALSYTIPPQELRKSIIRLDTQTITTPRELCKFLTLCGYTNVDMVDGAGQFAYRGGIVDIFAPGGFYINEDGEKVRADLPVRIEFFGDEIDRMGLFSIETQRMIESVECIEFSPAREILANAEKIEKLRQAVSEQFKSSKNADAVLELTAEINAIDGLNGELSILSDKLAAKLSKSKHKMEKK